MKKSLVALAALVAVGAASAQSVNVSGKLGFAYATSAGAGAVSAKQDGLGVTDGDFVIAASEDLGGGLKIDASMAVQSRGRTTAIAGRDATLALSGSFGSLTIGAIDTGNGILGLGGADAPTIGLDGAQGWDTSISRMVLADPGFMDILLYTSPDLGGLTFSVAMLDANGAGGMQSTAATQDATLVGVNYAAGPFAVAADYTSYGLNAVAAGADNRLRLSGSYDLGVVKFGLGYEKQKSTAAVNNTETHTLLGLSAPVGSALTVGATYVRNTADALNTITAYELGAGYSLSKRTGLQAAYQHISEDTVAGSATAFRVRLLHSF